MSSVKRIIVIDDDLISNKICSHVIKRFLPGIDVCSFISPEEGLEFIHTTYLSNPVKTILLLDINMPEMSGWNVLEELERYEEIIKEHLHIYICSSSVSLHDKAFSRKHPLVIDYMGKPLTK